MPTGMFTSRTLPTTLSGKLRNSEKWLSVPVHDGEVCLEKKFNLEKESWLCPRCGKKAKKYYCKNCGFVIYAGFIPRFVAFFIDLFIFALIYKISKAGADQPIGHLIFLQVCGLFLGVLYEVGLVGFYGQTLGKMFSGIKVVRLDGFRVHWSNAWWRYSVSILFSVFALLEYFYIANKTSMDQSLSSAISNTPGFFSPLIISVGLVTNIYDCSELLVLLTNQKRRAIHDFIAGTIVIHDPRSTRPAWHITLAFGIIFIGLAVVSWIPNQKPMEDIHYVKAIAISLIGVYGFYQAITGKRVFEGKINK